MPKISDFSAIRIKLASPDDILSWSHGEVLKPETINYRTQKPEKDGLFCERIFGPEKDYECYCGKYRRIRYKGIICDKCGVEVTRSAVRRERMGHIKLAVPVAHIWFLKSVPSRMGLFLDIPVQALEKVVYYAAYIVHWVNEEKQQEAMKMVEEEYSRKEKEIKGAKTSKDELDALKDARDKEIDRLKKLRPGTVLGEVEYHTLSLKYGEIFGAGTGAEAVRVTMENIKLEDMRDSLIKEITRSTGAIQKKAQRRLSLVQRMLVAHVRPEWMFLNVLPVLPPDLRPMVQLDGGRYATSDLNDLYRRVINRNNRLKKLQEINAPEIICRNEKRMLQEAVDALIDNSARKGTSVTMTTGTKRALKSLADMLKGKQGRFRQNLLGKRVDYSGRSVIVVGPKLKLYQCGLPKKMALELFRPFVIQKIIERELAYNVRAAGHLIEQAPPEVWDILEEIIEGKYVLLNRAPTLHRLGIQAFQPVLIEGEAIQLHPLVCTAYNADFDGDQMAVHLPLSQEAQKEAEDYMLSIRNLIKPATGSPVVNPTKDIVLGCYWMSKIKEGEKGEGMAFSSFDEAVLASDMGMISLKAKIRIRSNAPAADQDEQTAKSNFIETSAGRIIFNRILPANFAFVNQDLSAKMLRDIAARLIEEYPYEEAAATLDAIKDLGFHYATMSGISWAMDDLKVPAEKAGILKGAHSEVEKIKDQFAEGLLSVAERRNMIIEVWHRAKNDVTALVPKYLDPNGSVAMIISSGARGSWSQPNQLMGMKGLVINPAGQTMELPVESSFKEGFTALEYFISTHGARKGTADTALRTATAGYLTRRLVDVSQDVFITEEKCSDNEGFTLRRADADTCGVGFDENLFGRVAVKDVVSTGKDAKVIVKKNQIIDIELAKQIARDGTILEVQVYSPLTCKTLRGLCARCYGWDLGFNKPVVMGVTVGVVAAQAIGEPGTQLTMRTFHTGGVAGGGDITQGLPRVEEVFEARTPKGMAIVCDVQGVVQEIEEKENDRVIRIREAEGSAPKAGKGRKKKGAKSEEGLREFTVPKNVTLWVEKGDAVAPGAQLTEGHLDLKELFDTVGVEGTQRYIINEVQQIYTSQGASIHQKHIEVIVRQMFSRFSIEDAGDSALTPGEVAERTLVLEVQEELKKNGKKPISYKPLLLGITKVALSTSSFLSAASFQETSRVLIEAAIEGRVDHLRGLKESVIVGRLIPAGTGFGVGKEEA